MKRKSFKIGFLKCLTLLLIIAAPLAAQTKKEKEQAKKLFGQAEKLFDKKNYREAASTYAQSIALVATNPDAHYKKGYSHYYLNESDQALNEFALALSQGGQGSQKFKPLDIYRVRYVIYADQKNYDAALDDIRKGLALAPNDLSFLKDLGTISLTRNAFPDALAAFQKASQIAPNDADVYYNLARVHFAMADARGQAAAAETALAKGTRFPGETYYLLADARQKLRNPTGAIDAYQKAINSKPDLFQAYRSLAEVYHSENRNSDAIKTLENQGRKAFPSNGLFYTDISLYYSFADRPDDAVQAAKAGITLLPSQYRAYTYLCRAYNDLKNYSDAVSACNSALRLEPDDGETNYYLGNAYVGLGKSAEATGRYSKAVKGLADYTNKNPNDTDGWYLLGNASFAAIQYDNAIEAYLKCLSLSPNFLKARGNLGISYTRKKNKAAALEQYNFLLPKDATLAARLKAEIDKM